MKYTFYCKQCGDEATGEMLHGGKKQSICDRCKRNDKRRRTKQEKTAKTIEEAAEMSKFLLEVSNPYFFQNLTYECKPARTPIKNNQ